MLMSDMKTYYVRVDDNDVPFRLFRADGGTVTIWNRVKAEWVDTDLSPLQLGGLGGSADYQRLDNEEEAFLWRDHFTAEGFVQRNL